MFFLTLKKLHFEKAAKFLFAVTRARSLDIKNILKQVATSPYFLQFLQLGRLRSAPALVRRRALVGTRNILPQVQGELQ